ncbi:MAG: excalibur calcium-binding domain-containing protein [Phenylobacterium sp.]|nr:excalibur calcium-binding domain-containing protein [Phenylobacterium sp.]
MTQVSPLETRLDGPAAGSRLSQVNRRFRLAGSWEGRARLARIGRTLLVAYWIGCLAVIGLGLDRLFPAWRGSVGAVAAPVAESVPMLRPTPTAPFPNCKAAHAAGVYDIPVGSPAYRASQDGDQDGFACEPAPTF